MQDIPQDIELELEVLGSVLVDDKLIEELSDTIKINAFYDETHKQIYTAMLYLYNNNTAIGYKTLINRLQSKKDSDDEIVDYVLKLDQHVASVSNFSNQLELLKEIYEKRELYKTAKDIITSNIKGISSSNLINKLENSIENIGVTSNMEYERFEDYIDEWYDFQQDETPIKSHNLGFSKLNELVLLEDTNLMLIGARPSVGKSAYATNLVKNFCLQGKHPLFVSLEMNKKEFLNRLVSNMAHVEARKLKRKLPKTKDEWDRINKARERIKKFNFNFYDKGGMKIEQLYGLAKYLKKKGELDVLVIDYLQLLETHQFKSQKQNQVSYISQKLKQLAMELEIPVIALAQLNRGVVEHGKPREPQLSDLRDSGSLEQDSNIVIMLHTEDTEQQFGNDERYGRFIELFVRKNRDGKLGKINYSYFGDYIQFIEKEHDDIQGGYKEVQQEDIDILNKKETKPKPKKEVDDVIDIKEEDLPF